MMKLFVEIEPVDKDVSVEAVSHLLRAMADDILAIAGRKLLLQGPPQARTIMVATVITDPETKQPVLGQLITASCYPASPD